jgi:DNA-binding response OmpR family regulator
LNSQLPKKAIAVELDEDKFEKSITNLISNAIKFTPSGGLISIDAFQSNGSIQITISDNGEGISEDRLPHIFERYQSSALTNQKYKEGLGVGLAITKEYVELHSGSIKVESVVNEGARFTITLPILPEIELDPYSADTITFPIQNENSDTVTTLSSEPNAQILLLEDNIDMSKYVRSILDTHGFKTSHSENGVAGLEYLKTNSPDLIISDIMMPEMDGMEFLKEIRSLSKFEKTPTIFLTARSDIEGKIDSFRLGVNDYLVKPFNPEELIARVRNLLSFQSAREKLEIDLSEKGLEPVQDRFLSKLSEMVEDRMANASFNLEELASEMAMSRSTLYREIKRATGLSAGAFVKEVRLQKARQKLEHKSVKAISELSSQIGFTTVSYFNKQYKKRFGKKPDEYLH